MRVVWYRELLVRAEATNVEAAEALSRLSLFSCRIALYWTVDRLHHHNCFFVAPPGQRSLDISSSLPYSLVNADHAKVGQVGESWPATWSQSPLPRLQPSFLAGRVTCRCGLEATRHRFTGRHHQSVRLHFASIQAMRFLPSLKSRRAGREALQVPVRSALTHTSLSGAGPHTLCLTHQRKNPTPCGPPERASSSHVSPCLFSATLNPHRENVLYGSGLPA